MTPEDVSTAFVQKIYAGLITFLFATGAWLIKTTLSSRDAIIKLRAKVVEVEGGVKALKKDVEKIAENQTTPEHVRKVVKQELEEHAKYVKLEMKETTREIAREIATQVVREMRHDSTQLRRPRGLNTPRPTGDED